MTEKTEVKIPLSGIGIRHKARASIALIGNPNAGKSTLFNRLTGLRQTTGNFPGVTVEKHQGTVELTRSAFNLIDLPGIYSLDGTSTDERIAVDVTLGRVPGTERPSGLLVVIDATHIYQGLYLLEQLLELQLPTMIALTMIDAAKANGISIDTDALQSALGGIPVYPVSSISGHGLDELKEGLEHITAINSPAIPASWPEFSETAQQLTQQLGKEWQRIDVIQALLQTHPDYAGKLSRQLGADTVANLRENLFGDEPPAAVEARHRYQWVKGVIADVQVQAPLYSKISARLIRWTNRPWPATLLFFAVLLLVFQAVFTWATPMMDVIDSAGSALGRMIIAQLGDNAVSSFLADGVIAGVGSVIIFLPQILILFLFIIILEDTGYLARTSFLMDRVMRTVGLSGQSVIPMLSSFACAVPSIMATRVIPDRRDRIATILAAPFMTCSARLPIYALLIAAFVPSQYVGWLNLQGLVLFGLYLLGILGGLGTAMLLKSSALKGPKPHFMLALPEFRTPNLQTVAIKLFDRGRIFLKRAGTVIFFVAILVWVLAYFPRMDSADYQPDPVVTESLDQTFIDNSRSAAQMEQSWLGRIGRTIEPVFKPLGWDWRVSSAVVAGFPAREVVVAVMGTIYAVGSDADDQKLSEKLRSAKWPDGRLIFTLPMVLGLLVFYAWCLQCAATLATIRRETNSWRWPIFAWFYMTGIGYTGALVIYQVGSLL
ncbi:MAG: ferrous iron transport protein B [Xanthomonadales bacterium]|nr:ferrous iron transport protein B [Xanthomonadales bacterium]